jgi:hypothetical protein
MPHPCTHPPYAWGQPTTDLGLDEPGHYEPRHVYEFDLQIQHYPIFLEGLEGRMYPSNTAQEN